MSTSLLLGSNWTPIAIKWIMGRKQMIQNFISLSHSNMDVNTLHYTMHNQGNWMLAFMNISLCNVCVYPKVTSFNSCQWPFTQSSNTLELSLKWSWVWTFNFTFNLQFHLRCWVSFKWVILVKIIMKSWKWIQITTITQEKNYESIIAIVKVVPRKLRI